MELYLVTADVYDDIFGASITCFGIATNLEEMEKNKTICNK
jgi:hypothetical protein